MRFDIVIVSLVLALALPGAGAYGQATAERMYVFNCGEGHAADQSRWSPGVNVGVPLDVSDNCYLIHHANAWLLWDTGIPDSLNDGNQVYKSENSGTEWRRPKKLATQLAEIGVAPSEITYLAISHTHPDHIGNVELFPKATLLVQRAEYDWPNANGTPRFLASHPVHKLDGDYDVFNDGSVVIIATPGHTPGHQSLYVRLDHSGGIVLSGDAVHFRDNWEHRRVPAMNADHELTLESMEKIDGILARDHAELWINHDKPQSDAQKHSPAYYD